jgi:hypothetical protein
LVSLEKLSQSVFEVLSVFVGANTADEGCESLFLGTSGHEVVWIDAMLFRGTTEQVIDVVENDIVLLDKSANGLFSFRLDLSELLSFNLLIPHSHFLLIVLFLVVGLIV